MEIGNVGKTQSRHKSWDIDSTANFPRSLSPTYRRFILWRGNNISRRIKIQLYIKLSYIAPYLYLSRWYFLRFLPNPRAQCSPRFLSVILTPRCYGHHAVHTRGVLEASVVLTINDDFIAPVSPSLHQLSENLSLKLSLWVIEQLYTAISNTAVPTCNVIFHLIFFYKRYFLK